MSRLTTKPTSFVSNQAIALQCSRGGRLERHAVAVPQSAYDGHTLATNMLNMERSTGNDIIRILGDSGDRDRGVSLGHKFTI